MAIRAIVVRQILWVQDAAARILANESAAVIESYTAIGWNFCDSIRLV